MSASSFAAPSRDGAGATMPRVMKSSLRRTSAGSAASLKVAASLANSTDSFVSSAALLAASQSVSSVM
jgi:hypothetical protein